MARRKSTPNTDEIIAAFIQDIIVEVPEIVEKLSFSERRTLEREMKVLARTNEQKAIGRLREAKQTAREADAIEEDAHRKTDAALGAEAAAEGLERLTKHWHDKIQHHQLRRASNFMWFAVTLVAALFLFGLNQTGILQAIVLQLCNNDSLCPTPWQNFWQDAYLTAKGNTSWLWAILSLKGILLPVLGVAWLLRIFSRQNASHFALENDARQRLALLVSYVRLQENPDTKLTEEERILFLRTLFRTAEVSSKEDAQPNVVELIGKLKP
ncbi:hypothetical protein TRICHSKD4_3229 [Roseibium sp. TrichSKD4]|uniref:hypothetical protein n=1 Tax=Roseibium sp. TrichSKD4 TaxID=744980 RepID=UPI0001E56D9D|nr:hypothetical protein [Roseibium sp. TrichSKD4]EFO31535.1 hypothetical protein TRICHSKD4_3229 [Roseibium sp. TrichSKD4]